MLVLSHFKGHPSAGYGGALKQLAIGCASSRGKANIHSIGKTTSQHECWKTKPPQDKFLAAMARQQVQLQNISKEILPILILCVICQWIVTAVQ